MTSVEAWGNVTSPALHRDEDFRYLVHMDCGKILRGQNKPSYFIDNPDQIALATRLSASLIDPSSRRFFHDSCHGFIIDVPSSSVLATAPYDMQSASYSAEQLARAFPVKSAEELLEASRGYASNNEVLVSGEGIVVSGVIYVNQGDDWEPWIDYPFTAEGIRESAERMGLPLVTLDLIPSKHR